MKLRLMKRYIFEYKIDGFFSASKALWFHKKRDMGLSPIGLQSNIFCTPDARFVSLQKLISLSRIKKLKGQIKYSLETIENPKSFAKYSYSYGNQFLFIIYVLYNTISLGSFFIYGFSKVKNEYPKNYLISILW